MTLAQADQILVKGHDSLPSGCGQLKNQGQIELNQVLFV